MSDEIEALCNRVLELGGRAYRHSFGLEDEKELASAVGALNCEVKRLREEVGRLRKLLNSLRVY